MLMEPKISVVTISFNQAAFLEKTILSVLNQDYLNYEYIIIDGGSTDNSVEIIKKYEEKIIYWSSEPDNGPADALNKGFSIATGGIYTFLNSDDVILAGTFSKVINQFQKNKDIDILYGNCLQIDDTGKVTRKLYSNKWNFRRFTFGESNIIQQSAYFTKNIFKKVHGFNHNNHTCWDRELWARFGLAQANFFYLNEFLGAFRIHKDSITGSARLNEKYILEVEAIKKEIIAKYEIPIFYNRYLAKLEKFILSPYASIRSIYESFKYKIYH
ncbi:MAG TPA: glycosyltransferase [Ignavibacteriales bacterium]|nr:glycosyltransferase [Ignavibacteriales bacterium]